MLTAHVTTSVGWLGAVVAYIALDVAAVTGRDVQLVRSAYLMMELVVSYAIVPLAIASVIIGILDALHSVGGLVVLILVTILSVCKPRGMSPYGWRKQRKVRCRSFEEAAAVED